MGANGNRQKELARANLWGRRLELVIVAILTLSYVMQGTKNSISVLGLVVIMCTLWIPVIMAFFMYKANPSHEMIRHVIGVGYGTFYLAVCLISDQQLVYTYAFPMLLVVAIYCDFRFSVIVSSTVVAISIVHAVICGVRGEWTPHAIAACEIEIASATLVSVYGVIANKYIIGLNEKQMKAVNESNEKTENVLSQIMDISNELAQEVQTVSDKMRDLSESSGETLSAMNEVQKGTTQTASSVQNQMIKTEEIQEQIEKVSDASMEIGVSVSSAISAIGEGHENVKHLMDQAKISEDAGNGAVKEVEALKTSTEQMESIVSLIQSIASQTSMLSLNASIEAARAGEAGRGFAVVAEEISNLATQTKSATENINALITSVTTEMDEVAKAITMLVESNRIQTESAHITAESFEKIAGSSEEIKKNSKELSVVVKSLEVANKEIVQSIQTISDISEEVSTHSSTTFEKTEQNENIVEEVQKVVSLMTVNAQKLKEI